jgi:hypothetical protein
VLTHEQAREFLAAFPGFLDAAGDD